jgi:hypothetical protein
VKDCSGGSQGPTWTAVLVMMMNNKNSKYKWNVINRMKTKLNNKAFITAKADTGKILEI